MAAQIHDQIKRDVRDIIGGALETVAREKCPQGFRVSEDDFEKLLKIIKIKRIESDGECHSSAKGEKESRRSLYLVHSHRVHLTVQADFNVRVYCDKPIKTGAAAGGGTGAAVGTVSGAAGGVAVGALVGSVVPVAGTIVGGIIGGIVGGIGGLVTGGAVGAGAGAGIGAAHTSNIPAPVTRSPIPPSVPPVTSLTSNQYVEAVDVFRRLDKFSYKKNHNTCCCVVSGNTTCPYRAPGPGGDE